MHVGVFDDRLLLSVAPLSNEIRPVSSCSPPHLGPAIPEVLYSTAQFVSKNKFIWLV